MYSLFLNPIPVGLILSNIGWEGGGGGLHSRSSQWSRNVLEVARSIYLSIFLSISRWGRQCWPPLLWSKAMSWIWTSSYCIYIYLSIYLSISRWGRQCWPPLLWSKAMSRTWTSLSNQLKMVSKPLFLIITFFMLHRSREVHMYNLPFTELLKDNDYHFYNGFDY